MEIDFNKNMIVQDILTLINRKTIGLDYLISFGLSETQVFLLLNKIGHVTIYSKLSSKIRYEKDKLKGYKYFDRETNKEINNLAGFLYTNVFGDYLKD